jgi:hypothetical protein
MAFIWEGRSLRFIGCGGQTVGLCSVQIQDDLLKTLLTTYADVFKEPKGLPPPRRHDHRIHLLPGMALVAIRPYWYPQLLKDEVERQCDDMLAYGVIRPSTSPFSSPVLLVKKANISWHFCVDYRALNEKTIKYKFPIPVVDELLDELHNAKFFTRMDLRIGYHQVWMHPDDIEKTAFYTHQGHFEFTVMLFVLTNAPAMFQALMNEILAPYIRKFVLVFFDDILIYGSTWAKHLQHVKMVFELLCWHHLFLKQSKFAFGSCSVCYLRHIISADGVAMDPDRIAAMKSCPSWHSLRAMRGFLSLMSYYRKFIARYGDVAQPLTALLKWDTFHWSKEADHGFHELKQALMTAPLLQLLDFEQQFIVECDASGSGIGAVLHQGDDPIAFFSLAVATLHAKLPAYERELIGLVKVVSHWRPYL